jgi:hypothetical protein
MLNQLNLLNNFIKNICHYSINNMTDTRSKSILHSRLTPKLKVRTCKCPDIPLKKKRDIYSVISEYDCDIGDIDEIDIKVVFHLCYNLDKLEDDFIKKEVEYTLRLLNKDFSKQCRNFNNGEPIFKKTGFSDSYNRFINRSAASSISFSCHEIKKTRLGIYGLNHMVMLKNDIKDQAPPLDTNLYLNVWIIDSDTDVFSYSDYPWLVNDKLDGVIITKNLFGMTPKYQQYNMNKMLTHCIGHWLGLFHIHCSEYNMNEVDSFEDMMEYRGDFVIDTPLQKKQSVGNPYMDPRSCPFTMYDDVKEYSMFMNYMDNVEDLATFMFTVDQVRKMKIMIKLLRPRLIEENANVLIKTEINKKIKNINKLKMKQEEDRIKQEQEQEKQRILQKKQRIEQEKQRIIQEQEQEKQRIIQEQEKEKQRIIQEQEQEKQRIIQEQEQEKQRIIQEQEHIEQEKQRIIQEKIQEELQRVQQMELDAKRKTEMAHKIVEESKFEARLVEERIRSDKIIEDLKTIIQQKSGKPRNSKKSSSLNSIVDEIYENDDDYHLTKKYKTLKEAYIINKNKYVVLKKENMVLKNKYLLAKNKLVILQNKQLLHNWTNSKVDRENYGTEFSDDVDSLS